ncbi:MAG TPA: nuclear transport factor 2 family protein [Anaeromyxobacter sp.]
MDGFFDSVANGSVREAVACLAEGATIDDPGEGRISGRRGLERWVAGVHAWLEGLSARPEPVRLTAEGRHAVLERTLHIRVDRERRQLPVAVAADLYADGRLAAVRVYHSFWTLERGHRVRGRLLPARRGLALRPPFDAYHRALAEGDVEAVLACFARDGTVREPAGEPFLHRGLRGLRRLYGTMLMNGGIPLEHARASDDGVACALEYTVVRWGRTELPPQAGVAVYERDASGLIRASRIYDDVDPPRE